ncbi:MAG: LysR family transcriptional regulator [Pseudomonadota bacterium]
MDLDALQLFTEVYGARSFAAAAKARGLAPSSVSRRIAALEGELGARLFARSTRVVTPTEAGEAFFQRLEPALAEIAAAADAAANETREAAGRVRISASPSFAQCCLIPILPEFRERHPAIGIDLALSDARVDLTADRIDIAFRHGRLEDSGYICSKLMDVRYRLVASAAYAEKARAMDGPEDVGAHACLAMAYPDYANAWRFRRGAETVKVSLSPAVTASNATALLACVEAGMGMALLAGWLVDLAIEAGDLREMAPSWRVSGEAPEAAIWTLLPSRRFTPARVRLFADHVKAKLAAPRGE